MLQPATPEERLILNRRPRHAGSRALSGQESRLYRVRWKRCATQKLRVPEISTGFILSDVQTTLIADLGLKDWEWGLLSNLNLETADSSPGFRPVRNDKIERGHGWVLMEIVETVGDFLVGDLMAAAETGEWRARDAEWWRELTRKRRGEMAEAAFLHKASRLGFGVAKPWGDSDPYDLIVDSGRRLWRVQVKSAYRCDKYGGYTFHAHGNAHKKVYSWKDIDMLVAYVVPEDLWYVVPVSVFRRIKSMKLFPVSRRRRSKFEVYREAWELFGKKTGRR
jgi:hypothetical protein